MVVSVLTAAVILPVAAAEVPVGLGQPERLQQLVVPVVPVCLAASLVRLLLMGAAAVVVVALVLLALLVGLVAEELAEVLALRQQGLTDSVVVVVVAHTRVVLAQTVAMVLSSCSCRTRAALAATP